MCKSLPGIFIGFSQILFIIALPLTSRDHWQDQRAERRGCQRAGF
jgi:hypothetical protein